jgi:hypothetical protein
MTLVYHSIRHVNGRDYLGKFPDLLLFQNMPSDASNGSEISRNLFEEWTA